METSETTLERHAANGKAGDDEFDDGSSGADFPSLTAGLLARKGEAAPAHDIDPDDFAEEIRPQRRTPKNPHDKKKRVVSIERDKPRSPRPAPSIGPIFTDADSEYTSNPYQFAASQKIKDIVERDPVYGPDMAPAKESSRHQRAAANDGPEVFPTPAFEAIETDPPAQALRAKDIHGNDNRAEPEPLDDDDGPRRDEIALELADRESDAGREDASPSRAAGLADAAPAPEKSRAAPVAAPSCRRKKARARKAAVTFRMSTHDFLRMKLASAELQKSCQDILLKALKDYLDALGVESLDECTCLARAGDVCDKITPPAT